MKRNKLKEIIRRSSDFPAGSLHRKRDGKDEPIPIEADLTMWACLLDHGRTVSYQWKGLESSSKNEPGLGYVHHIMTSGFRSPTKARLSKAGYNGSHTGEVAVTAAVLKIGEVELVEGDGAMIRDLPSGHETVFENVGTTCAEFVLFDLGSS